MQQAKAKQEEKRNLEAEQKKSNVEEAGDGNGPATGVPDSWEDTEFGGGDGSGGGKKKVRKDGSRGVGCERCERYEALADGCDFSGRRCRVWLSPRSAPHNKSSGIF